MTPAHLTLAAVAALAAAGKLKKRGSRSSHTVVTREGWPFPSDYLQFHATAGLQSIIRDGRFKTRSQTGSSMTGGGTDKAVSLTLDPRVADAILIGLKTMRLMGRGEMSLIDFFKKFKSECPKAVRKIEAEPDIEYDPVKIGRISRGLLEKREYMGSKIPPGAIAGDKGWEGSDGRYHRSWWVKPETDEEKEEHKRTLYGMIHNYYNYLTAMGSSTRECYWPSFWSTDVEALAKMPADQLGFMRVAVDIERITSDAGGLLMLGYLSEQQARYNQREVRQLNGYLKRDVEGSRWKDDWNYKSSLYRLRNIGAWSFEDTGEASRSTTMVFLPSMAEFRVYDPSKIRIQSTQTADERLDSLGMEDRVTYPPFNESRLPGNRLLPGRMILGDEA